MSSFTMELKNVISACDGDIGLKDYPIFDESHRGVLNKKIIDHYWNMEIGIASIDDWRFVLNRTMREIMPKYNQLYKSELLTFNPLITMDMKMVTDALANTERESTTDGTSKTDSTGENTGTGSSNTDSTSEQLANQQTGTDTKAKARAVSGTTPQKRLAGNMDYASSVADNTSDTATDTDVTSSDTAESSVDQTTSSLDKSKSNVDGSTNVVSADSGKDSNHSESASKGYSGSPSALLQEFRDTILNIDLDIIEELSDLFMIIWSTGDQYTNNYHLGGYRNGFKPII